MRAWPLSLLLAGCATVASRQLRSPTTLEPLAAFDCAERAAVRLGYGIVEANRESGFFRAETPQPVAMTLGGQPVIGRLAVTLLRGDPMELSVAGTDEDDVQAVLRSCRGPSP